MIKLKRCKIIAMLLVATVTVSLSGYAVKADSSTNGTVGGEGVYAGSWATATAAGASTSGQNPYSGISASVSSHYIAICPRTGTKYEEDKYNSGTHSASVSFSAPINYQTVSITSWHEASKNGETWSGPTFQQYPNVFPLIIMRYKQI